MAAAVPSGHRSGGCHGTQIGSSRGSKIAHCLGWRTAAKKRTFYQGKRCNSHNIGGSDETRTPIRPSISPLDAARGSISGPAVGRLLTPESGSDRSFRPVTATRDRRSIAPDRFPGTPHGPPDHKSGHPDGPNAPARVLSRPPKTEPRIIPPHVSASLAPSASRTGVRRRSDYGPGSASWCAEFWPLAPLHQAWNKAGREWHRIGRRPGQSSASGCASPVSTDTRHFADPSTRVGAGHRRHAIARERLSDRKTSMTFDRGDGRVAQDVR